MSWPEWMPPASACVVPTPYYADESVILFHGDNRLILPLLRFSGVKVDLLLTDAPYAISQEGQTARGPKKDRNRDFFSQDRDSHEVLTLVRDVLDLTYPMLTNKASVYWWTGHVVFGAVEEFYRRRGWETRPFAWTKPNAPPPMPHCFPSGIEIGCHGYRPYRTWNEGHMMKAFFDVAKFDRDSQNEHPNRKVPPVTSPIIAASSDRGGLILDPFSGSGAILHEARRLGRRAIGIEESEHWCREAALMLSQSDLPFVDQAA